MMDYGMASIWLWRRVPCSLPCWLIMKLSLETRCSPSKWKVQERRKVVGWTLGAPAQAISNG